MKPSGEAKFLIGSALLTLVILVGAIFMFSKGPKVVPQETLIPKDVLGVGAEEAKVTLVEFSDFECAACGAAHPFIKKALEKYPRDLRVVFRHFPLEQHKNAFLAAEAAEAAAAQDKFWEMADLLFESQTELSDGTIRGLAVELKLDMEKFNRDLQERKYKTKIAKDINDGQSLGVSATPTFFLNGQKINLFSLSDLDSEIQKQLR